MTTSAADFRQIANALCPWGKGYSATRAQIGDRGIDRCWEMADGYGRSSLADLRDRGLSRDWSHIRDSSDRAIERIWAYLQKRGVVGSCPTCKGSGAVYPHPTALVAVQCPSCKA